MDVAHCLEGGVRAIRLRCRKNGVRVRFRKRPRKRTPTPVLLGFRLGTHRKYPPVYFNKDAAGQDQLATLAEKGVGAILLAHADTPFEVKDAQNQLQGRLRASGVYLRESGGVGSVQQIDLRV